MDERPRNFDKIMETTSQFDLTSALQRWIEKLGQSPQVKAENLKELESHVRDSVVQLQNKGLSPEESFLVATYRVGSLDKLEPEFAKVNRNPLNMIIHGLILVFFSIGCFFMWALLSLPELMERSFTGLMMPAFTQFILGFRPYLFAPPLLAAIYCLYVWILKSNGRSSWMGFFSMTMAALVLLTFPVIMAVLMPMIAFMDTQIVAK